MSALGWLRLAYEIGSELWREHRRDQAAAKAWAETRSTVRGCPRCREIVYGPGQTTCGKCGAALVDVRRDTMIGKCECRRKAANAATCNCDMEGFRAHQPPRRI